MGVAPGSLGVAGEMKGGVMMAGVLPGRAPCILTAYPSDRACKSNCTLSLYMLQLLARTADVLHIPWT